MSDSYQPIYDAMRSRLHNGDIGSAVENAVRQGFDFSLCSNVIIAMLQDIAYAQTRPSVVYRPRIALDGKKWIACLGDNIQEGVVGIGDSPEKCMADFDKAWTATFGEADGEGAK